MILEIAANSVTSAIIAQFAGAGRLEFFTNISEGGTTPTYGQMKLLRDKIEIPVHVMLRPRGGDFLYNELEFEEMLHDLALIRQMGFAGIVFGILTADGHLDMVRNKTLVELAKPMNSTLHRAFDRTADPVKALEDAISCGFERILTSGQVSSAADGTALLEKLVQQAGDRIKILAGSGITPDNVLQVIAETGVNEVHSTAKTVKAPGMRYKNAALPGDAADVQYECSPEIVRLLKSKLSGE
jgi:copper homeostasis protein